MILNDEQKAAVAFDGHLSLVSCPGSGKTRTVVAKILKCLEDVRGSTRRIGCITYTNTAVNEIEHRLRRLGSRSDDLYYEICTIHSFCLNHILRTNHHLLPEFGNGFEVLAPDDARWHQLVKALVARHKIDGRRVEGFERIERTPDGAIITPPEIGAAAASEFADYMDRNSFVSFSDMVYHSLRLVSATPSIARGLASRFAWLLIDEFQDTTVGQVELFKSIAAHQRTTFFLVGDPNQSIMGFAGGHPGLMDEFASHLAANKDVRLHGNYRCSERIIAHAERLRPSDPPMQALGENAEFPTEPELVHASSVTEAIFDHFLPAVDSLRIPLGETAVLAPWWITLLSAARELRQRGVAMIGPGARPYKRSRDLAQFAEHACAYLEEPEPAISQATHRALFFMLLNITGNVDWRVYSYEGRKTREIAAEKAGFGNDKTYRQAAKVVKNGTPELIQAMDDGRVSISAASILTDADPDEQEAIVELDAKAILQAAKEIRASHAEKRAKHQAATTVKPQNRTKKQRLKATRLIHGDCRQEMKKLRAKSVDLILTDPPYPEIDREYGKLTEAEWHDLMHAVVTEGRRVLKPTGSMVVILQPNFEKIGQMRVWLWEFMAWAGREWNLVQDCYWWNHGCLPSRSSNRKYGLMRQSMKMCVWLGPADCYRNQDNVLWLPCDDNFAQCKSDSALRVAPSGQHYRGSRIANTVAERGGSTPFNLLPVAAGGGAAPNNAHPASTPYEVAAWWVKYLLPKGGVLLDNFAGSGTMLLAGLDFGASRVIGIDKQKKYLKIAEKRLCE